MREDESGVGAVPDADQPAVAPVPAPEEPVEVANVAATAGRLVGRSPEEGEVIFEAGEKLRHFLIVLLTNQQVEESVGEGRHGLEMLLECLAADPATALLLRREVLDDADAIDIHLTVAEGDRDLAFGERAMLGDLPLLLPPLLRHGSVDGREGEGCISFSFPRILLTQEVS